MLNIPKFTHHPANKKPHECGAWKSIYRS